MLTLNFDEKHILTQALTCDFFFIWMVQFAKKSLCYQPINMQFFKVETIEFLKPEKNFFKSLQGALEDQLLERLHLVKMNERTNE